MRSAARYVALFGVLFVVVTLFITVVFAVVPTLMDTLRLYPWIILAAAGVSFLAVLVEILDDIRSARQP